MNHIRISPNIGLSSLSHKCGGGWRVWEVARMLDTQGSGRISLANLRVQLVEYGISASNIRNWLHQAFAVGLLAKQNRRDGTSLLIMSRSRAALLFTVVSAGRDVETDPNKLFTKGWRKHLWSCYILTTSQRPISQKTKQDITGISPRSQQNYQRGNGSKVKNYRETSFQLEHLSGLNEVTPWHYEQINGRVYQRLPDTRIAPAGTGTLCTRGRSRKVQHLIHGSLSKQRAEEIRMFNFSYQSAKRQLQNLRKRDILAPKPVLEMTTQYDSICLWREV